jgi:hypothetical protein
MRKGFGFTVLALIGCAWAASEASAPNTLTAQEKKDGWTLLFDGKTMTHWVDPSKMSPPGDAWSVEDGCLKTHSKARITEDLFSQDTYRDFELSWEWRISVGGNSGLKYRIQDHLFIVGPDKAIPRERFEARVERSFVQRIATRPDRGQDYVVGFEYQMTDDAKNGDALGNPKHTAGALYDMVVPASAAAKPAGEFNTSRILVRGNHVEHWMNGVKVVDSTLDSSAAMEGIKKRWANSPHVYDLLANQPKKDCPISLQNHGDDAWFRSIKIRRLK